MNIVLIAGIEMMTSVLMSGNGASVNKVKTHQWSQLSNSKRPRIYNVSIVKEILFAISHKLSNYDCFQEILL